MEKFEFVIQVLPWVAAITAIAVGGWLLHTWLRIKHGYPLDGAWGQAIYPKSSDETIERVKLLSTENAQLRAELGSIKDRLATVERIELLTNENAQLRAEIGAVKDRLETIERIVTDQPSKLAREIDALSIDKGGHA